MAFKKPEFDWILLFFLIGIGLTALFNIVVFTLYLSGLK
jgi:hypothetical protein